MTIRPLHKEREGGFVCFGMVMVNLDVDPSIERHRTRQFEKLKTTDKN